MKPLSEPQKQVLVAMLAYGGYEAWTIHGLVMLVRSRGILDASRRHSHSTLLALERRGLVKSVGWRWALTNEGRDTAEKLKADAAAPPAKEGKP